MSVISELTGTTITPNVTKTLPLVLASGESATGPKASNPQSVPPPLRSLHTSESVRSQGSPFHGHEPEGNQPNLIRFKTWAEEAITSQQKDIDRISGAVDRIEREMRSLKEMMYEIRDELTANRQIHSAREDTRTLRTEIEALRDEIRINAQRPTTGTEGDRRLAKDTAAEVEELKRELRRLKRSLNDSSIQQIRGSDNTPSESALPTGPPHRASSLRQNDSTDPRIRSDVRNGINNVTSDQLQSPVETSPEPAQPISDERRVTSSAVVGIAGPSSGKARWVYTGQRDAPHMKVILPLFGIKYNNTKIADAVSRLERHVERTGQEDTDFGRQYGRMVVPGEEGLTVSMTPFGTSRKRSHEHLEDESEKDTTYQPKKPMSKPGTPSAGQYKPAKESTSEPRKHIISLLGDSQSNYTNSGTDTEKPLFEKRVVGDREVKVMMRPGWRRNSEGLLLTPSGKIDGRSLKILGNAANRRGKDGSISGDGVLPSIEKDAEKEDADARRREEERIEEAEAKRRAELRAREQLVAQTLESEVER